MDAYPRHYVEHNTPLLVLSGLREAPVDINPHPNDVYVSCSVPAVDTPSAKTLLRCFLASNTTGIWSGKDDWKSGNAQRQSHIFRVKAVGRVNTFSSFFDLGDFGG